MGEYFTKPQPWNYYETPQNYDKEMERKHKEAMMALSPVKHLVKDGGIYITPTATPDDIAHAMQVLEDKNKALKEALVAIQTPVLKSKKKAKRDTQERRNKNIVTYGKGVVIY